MKITCRDSAVKTKIFSHRKSESSKLFPESNFKAGEKGENRTSPFYFFVNGLFRHDL